MNPLDLGVIAVIVLSALFAFARGFVREALSIVAWIAAAAITLYGFNTALGLIEPHVQNTLLSQVIAGCGLFVISLVILTIATGILARMVHASGLTPIDRTLGLVFGLVRGVFLVCLAWLLLDMSVQPNERPAWIRDARSGSYLHEGAGMLQSLLPDTLKTKSADDLIKTLSPVLQSAEEAKKFMAPPPVATPAPAATTPTYPKSDKKQLDRVIRAQQ